MAKRTLYFLRDSITGLYYTGQGNNFYSWNNTGDVAIVDPNDKYHTFENAVIHTTENSVKSGQKSRARSFKSQLAYTDEQVSRAQWLRLTRDLAREREKLPFFGIEIVKIEVSD